MLKTSTILTWIFLIVFCVAAIAAAQTIPLTGEIRVAVRVEGTQVPIAGVELSLSPARNCGDCLVDLPDKEVDLLAFLQELAAARGIVNGQVRVDAIPSSASRATVITDEAVNASFRDVRFGTYEVSARRAGYIGVVETRTEFPERIRVITRESSVTVTLGQHPADALLFLAPTAMIRGHVRDKNGAPVADVSVGLVRVGGEGGRRIVGAPAGMAKTDAAGEYILTAEQLGNFLLRISRTSSGIMSFVYHPGTEGLENATLITLERGMSLSDLDFQLK